MAFSNLTNATNKTLIKIFGIPVTYTHSSDDSVAEIKGVFENSFVEVNGVTDLKPTLKIRTADLELTPQEDDQVEVNSTEYTVVDAQLDTHGIALLILKKN